MRGHLRERTPGHWEMRVDAGTDPVTHQRRQISRTFRGNRRGAERALRALAQEVDEKRHVGTEGTVDQLLEAWTDQAASGWSPTTIDRTEQIVRLHLSPTLGAIPLSRLEAADLDAFYRKLRKQGLKPATIRKCHNVIRRALSQAVRWSWLPANPALGASPPVVPKTQIDPPAPDEVLAVIELLDKTDPESAAFFHLAALTGMRRGELCGLHRSDVDLDERTILVRRAVVQVGTELTEKTTKTHRQRRISLDTEAVRLLSEQLARRAKAAENASVKMAPDPYVFPDKKRFAGDEPATPRSWTQRYRRVAKEAGLKGVRLHDSRHMHATRLLGGGMDVRTVAGRLGHAQASTTLDIYGHFLPAADRRAAEMIGEILSPKQKPPKKS